MRVPIVVGGSALYVRAIVDRFDFPGTDPVVRAQLEAELELLGPASALRAAGRCSIPPPPPGSCPTTAAGSSGPWRSSELTGRPFSADLPEPVYALPDVVQIGLDIDRATLDARIEQRVARMWRQGFVAEVARLADRGLRAGRTASRALGYRQVLDFLAGEITEEEARAPYGAGHATVRPPAGLLVPAGPADLLAPLRPARPGPAALNLVIVASGAKKRGACAS